MPDETRDWRSYIGSISAILVAVGVRMGDVLVGGRSLRGEQGDVWGGWETALQVAPAEQFVSVLQSDPVWWSGSLFVLLVGVGGVLYGCQCRPRWWRHGRRWVRGVLAGTSQRARGTAPRIDTALHLNALQLRERLEEKTALFASTVHDLKTPLLGIRQLSALVLDDATLSEDGRRKLELIRATADEAMGRVDQLLATATDEEGMRGWVPVKIETLVTDVVRRLRPHAECKEQRLRCRFLDASCRVEGDELRLQEAVGNLVSNALKYSPQGETIDVAVTSSAERVRISVSDNGPGLSEDDQKRLFSPFQRLTPQPTGNERSSGVGLYITKQVMNLHGGEVELRTAEGEGSTFALVLPMLASTTGDPRPSSTERDAPSLFARREKKR